MQAKYKRRALCLALAAIGPGFVPAHAEEAGADGRKALVLEEVIVTATRREETLNNVAVSVAALNGEQIAAFGQRNLESAVANVPNVGFTTTSSGNNLTIRGVGSPALDNVQSSVATFIDGVYITRSRNASAPLYDVQQIEVLRGPQGALFGKNSIAGVFNVVTQKPTQQFEGLVDVRAGNFDSHEGTLVLSGGLTDTLSARFAAFNRSTGDYLKNNLDGGDGGGSQTEAYRLSLAWTPSDNTDVGLKYEHFYNRLDNAIYQLISLDPADRERLTQPNGPLTQAQVNNIDTKLNRRIDAGLSSYTGVNFGLSPDFYSKTGTTFITLSFNHSFDNDYELSATIGDTHSDFRNKYASSDYPVVGIWQDSNVYSTSDNFEIRLASPVQDKFRFTIGAYADRSRDITNHGYSQANFEAYGAALNGGLLANSVPAGLLLTPEQLAPGMQVIVPGDNSNPSYTTSYALYGEATYEFTEQWSATVGVRGAIDKRTLKQDYSSRVDLNGNPLGSAAAVADLVPAGPLAGAQTGIYAQALPALLGRIALLPGAPAYNESRMDKALLPAGKIEFRPNADTLIYLSAQTGYKNGGFNTATFGAPTIFDKEKSLAFELGAKLAVADGRGQINGSLFQTKFDDLQVAALDPVTGAVGFTNAAKATSRGIELNTTWRLTEAVTVGASYAYLDATYDSFKQSGCNIDNTILAGPAKASSCTQDLSGARLQRAPLNSASGYINYVQPLTGPFELQANLSANYRGSYFTDLPDSEQLRADETTVFDARVALVNTVDKWTIAAVGNNITNNQDMVGGQASSSLTQSARTYFGQMRPPAMYWLEFEKRF